MLIIEKIRGKPLPMKVVQVIQIAGLILIVGLFVAVLFNDIRRLL